MDNGLDSFPHQMSGKCCDDNVPHLVHLFIFTVPVTKKKLLPEMNFSQYKRLPYVLTLGIFFWKLLERTNFRCSK